MPDAVTVDPISVENVVLFVFKDDTYAVDTVRVDPNKEEKIAEFAVSVETDMVDAYAAVVVIAKPFKEEKSVEFKLIEDTATVDAIIPEADMVDPIKLENTVEFT